MFNHKDMTPTTFETGNSSADAVLWTDKKRPIFGKPISFTRYTLYQDRLIVDSGLIVYRQEEMRLYRVLDITMRQTLTQRLFGVGTIFVTSGDASTPKLLIKDIKNPKDVMKLFSNITEAERQRYRIGMIEGLSGLF